MSVRPAQLEDVPQLTALAAQLGYPTTEDALRARLEALMPEDDHAVFVAVNAENHVTGWISLFVYRPLMRDPLVMVAGLVVNEACRGQGIGQLLMERAETWARERDCEGVYLKSSVKRVQAHAFYEHLGYRNTKTQFCFFKAVSAEAELPE
ncbi:MAG: GNAT family N-acetyltransferase [Anaerolineae bacterium]|nr:GNAT family N-acetyltransferase [Anaerolineae bacterium]